MDEYNARDAESYFADVHDDDLLQCKEDLIYKAKTMIDTLTHNRVKTIGWDYLTEYQRFTLKECMLEIVLFLYENKDLLETPLSSYSINGVSMQFKFNPTVFCQGGVIMNRTTYTRLVSTGLCYAGGMR